MHTELHCNNYIVNLYCNIIHHITLWYVSGYANRNAYQQCQVQVGSLLLSILICAVAPIITNLYFQFDFICTSMTCAQGGELTSTYIHGYNRCTITFGHFLYHLVYAPPSSLISCMLKAYINHINGCFDCFRAYDIWYVHGCFNVKQHMQTSRYSQNLPFGLA